MTAFEICLYLFAGIGVATVLVGLFVFGVLVVILIAGRNKPSRAASVDSDARA